MVESSISIYRIDSLNEKLIELSSKIINNNFKDEEKKYRQYNNKHM